MSLSLPPMQEKLMTPDNYDPGAEGEAWVRHDRAKHLEASPA